MTLDELLNAQVKGFLDPQEARGLYLLTREASPLGPCLEIGSYCGKATLFLGQACKENGAILFSLDHHRGSEEQQPGETYYDQDLLDCRSGLIDTFPFFRKTLRDFHLEDTVVAICSPSALASCNWTTPLSLVFIDGVHSFAAAYADYSLWMRHLLPGGFLVIHDIFHSPEEGGQAPRVIYQLALASGLFEEVPGIKTLGILKRARQGEIPPVAQALWEKAGGIGQG